MVVVRLGMIVYLKVAEIAAEEGLDYLVVHPRHAGQRTVSAATISFFGKLITFNNVHAVS